MRTDIFPEIRIPVVTVIWSYTGLSTPEMEQRVTTYSQYAISANVNGIKNIEAQTLAGLSVQKIYFQPDVNLDLAISQIVAATNSIRALMPPGIQPPVVVQFNASSVPVLQISLSSDTLNEQQLYDYGIYRVRQQLAPIPGITLPTPAGGKYRQIMVDIDPAKLVAKGLTPLDVVNAVNAQNLTLPSGTAKIGDKQYVVRTNATPASIDALNDIPIKVVNGATVFVKDVGPGARRLAGPAERRAPGRQALGPAQHHQERQRLDAARSSTPSSARLADDPARPPRRASRSTSCSTSRCSSSRRWKACCARARSPPRLTALDDPAVPGVVAVDPGGDDLHPAVDPVVAGGALLPGRDHQHPDPGRPRARRRHPGRRFHGHHREHAPPAHRGAPCRCRRRRLHGAAGIAIPTLVSTLAISSRVHVGGVPRRPGEVPVHAAGACRRVRHAGLLRPVADPDPDHHRPADQGREPCAADEPRSAGCSATRIMLSSAASRHAPALCRAAGTPDRQPVHRARPSPSWSWRAPRCCSPWSAATSSP